MLWVCEGREESIRGVPGLMAPSRSWRRVVLCFKSFHFTAVEHDVRLFSWDVLDMYVLVVYKEGYRYRMEGENGESLWSKSVQTWLFWLNKSLINFTCGVFSLLCKFEKKVNVLQGYGILYLWWHIAQILWGLKNEYYW